MKTKSKAVFLCLFSLIFLLPTHVADGQTKRLKRPKSSVGVGSVDNFVRESFDLYDKMYKYDGYAAAGTPLDDHDIDVLEDALSEMTVLSESAPNIISDLDGVGVLKQGKATLHMNKAQKALNYSIKTAKELLVGSKESTEGDPKDTTEDEPSETSTKNPDTSTPAPPATPAPPKNVSDDLEILGKFDFVPGDKLLFFDDFSKDFVGDFPAKWNTNASGEIVKINGENWFEVKPGYGIYFIPDIESLPEDYSIEFDLLTQGLSSQTSSTARMTIILSDDLKFDEGAKHYAQVSLPFGQYSPFDIRAYNFFNGGAADINSMIKVDIRNAVLNQPHISISVTKKRYRLWVNEVKYIDIPRFIQELGVLNHLKFNINNVKDGQERIFIKNLKVAEGGVDLRRKLLAEGKISTNGILFDSGSANIKKQSYGIIRQISQVLMQDESIKLQIVGHTDSDGDENGNLKLSKSRAEAVKNALINVYKITGNRLTTDGKGESDPVGDNSTTDGKAKNRRVEFIKQ